MREVHPCPLCEGLEIQHYYEDKKRCYFQCCRCKLVFVPDSYHLSEKSEKLEYDKHINSPEDLGYRKFLSRIFDPVSEYVISQFSLRCSSPCSSQPSKELINSRSVKGLDFGCGPGPTLSVMFQERGLSCDIYDKYYFPSETVLKEKYDFITASEVIEHLRLPRQTLAKIWSCLNPGGCLGIMTKRVTNREAFQTWHYKNDSTHIGFYSIATFQWLSNSLGAELRVVGKDVVLLIKCCG